MRNQLEQLWEDHTVGPHVTVSHGKKPRGRLRLVDDCK